MADASRAQPLVCVLGRLRVEGTDGLPRIPSGQPERSLLLFLALHGGTVHTEQVMEALWPGLPLDSARPMLRNVLSRLRQSCGPIIEREGACLVLRADTDLREYQEALATLLQHAGQELAPDVRYADWAEDVRHHLAAIQQRLAALL